MLLAREEGKPVDAGLLNTTVRGAVSEKVKRQVEIGLTVVNDGEQSKISFATYVRERLHGFGGADGTDRSAWKRGNSRPGPRAVRPHIGGRRATPRWRGRILLPSSRTSRTSQRRPRICRCKRCS